MKVILLQPNYDAHIVHPPLGLGYLASFLRLKGHKVSIFDGTLKNASINDFVLAVANSKADLAGISLLTRGYRQTKMIIKALKRKFKKFPVVIGGTQVTAAPKEVIQDLKADFAIIGEGEQTLAQLADALETEKKDFTKIKGLAFKNQSNQIIINQPRSLIANLNSLPFPAWDLMPPKDYRIAPILEPAKAFPVAPVLTSRGCPFNCSFCASNITWERKIRFRTPANVLTEIKMLKNNFGVKEIHFCDDNFTMDINRAEKICDLLLKERINLPWQCPNGVRIDRLSLPLLKKMRQAGCYSLGLGIESGNQKILNQNNKNLDLRIVPQVLKNIKKVGIESYGFFILGLPGDNKNTVQETIDFALKNPFDRAWFNIFTPYPGSAAFSKWLGHKKLKQINWDSHDCSTAVVHAKNLSAKDLEVFQKKALLKFYGRPKIFINVIEHLGLKEITTFLMSRFFSKFLKLGFLITHKLIRKK